jgi:hypothetical protein
MPAMPKTMNQELAEKIGRDFAKECKLPMDDPIVKDLIRGCKMTLGAAAYRNRRRAERVKDQMMLLKLPETTRD